MSGEGSPVLGDAPASAERVSARTVAGAPASADLAMAPAREAARAQADVAMDDPVFREPWEAQAFAMTVLLHQRGLFTWPEWAQTLSAQIAAAPQMPYYQHWLAALESLVASKGLSSPDELTRYQRAWEHAAHRTPHGRSIDLGSEDIGA